MFFFSTLVFFCWSLLESTGLVDLFNAGALLVDMGSGVVVIVVVLMSDVNWDVDQVGSPLVVLVFLIISGVTDWLLLLLVVWNNKVN